MKSANKNQIRLLVGVLFLFCGFSLETYSQNEVADSATESKTESPFNVGGRITLSSSTFHSFDESGTVTPYSYNLSGSMNISYKKLNIPFSLYYNDGAFSFARPTLYFGVSPSIGKTTFHLGFRNMTFSKYLMSGNTFLGVGIESDLGFLRVQGMYGKMRNMHAYSDDLFVEGLDFLQDYGRTVYAGKLGFGRAGGVNLDLMVMGGRSDYQETNLTQNVDVTLFPKENVAVGLITKIPLFKRLTFETEAVVSAYTENTSADAIALGNSTPEFVQEVFTPTITSYPSYAVNAGLRYAANGFSLGLVAEQIGPEFRTIATFYNQSDTRNIQLNFQKKFKKIKIGSSLGFQENDFSSYRSGSNIRRIFSLNLAYSSGKRYRLNLRYANHNFDKTPTIEAIDDSLKVVSVQNRATLANTLKIGKDRKSSLRLMASFRRLDNKFALENQTSASDLYSLRLFWTSQLYSFKYQFSLGYNQYKNAGILRENPSIGFTLSKTFAENRIKLKLSNNYTLTNVVGKSNGGYWVSNATLTYQVTNFIAFNFASKYLNRSVNVGSNRSELRMQASLSLGF